MTPEKLIDALRINNAYIIFPDEKSLKKAVKYMGFYETKPKHVVSQLYSYKGIPLRYENKEN